MTFGVLWLLLTLLKVGLQCVIVVFPDHTHLLFSYSSILLIKIQQKSEIWLSMQVGGYHAISGTKNIRLVEN